MDIKITEQQYNPLLKRKEVYFIVDHSKTKGTPTRLELRKALAEMLRINTDLVYIKKVETKAGTMRAVGWANAYDSVEQAKFVEPKYIIARNTPKEAKEASEKQEAAKPAEAKTQQANKEG